ncbi:MAG: class I SAM-dependent methyltransferase [Rhodospirillaceae bacterium]|jgi:SAM-dependent methyltransferase|nr:class I SAM-dependent methyltransferase [Rhodospirillaceae bacterium]
MTEVTQRRSIFPRLSRLMLIVEILHTVAVIRYLYFRLVRRGTKVADQTHDSVSANTVMHNLKGIRRSIRRVGRSSVLIRPLSIIPRLQRRLPEAKVLSIGPRSEAELLCLASHGFRLRNVTGVDLLSYSPRIDIGDMHALSYADDSFDVVIASRVLGYSDAPEIAAAEMLRVTRHDGYIAINTGDLQPDSATNQDLDYKPGSDRIYSSLADILDLFGTHVGHVHFSNDPSVESGKQRGPILVIFRVNKPQMRTR